VIKLIPLAIPVFFLLIGVEVLVARLQGRRDYLRFNDAVTALSCGVTSQVVKVFTGAALLGLYVLVFEWARPFSSALPWGPQSAIAWLLALVLLDHQYYWWHRHSHRINFMWAAHVVHHHSQEYNLAVALRQAMFTNITSVPYYLPLAILGIDPIVFGLSAAINTLYQFWIHTRTVRTLGPLEWVLNTPSHHRVHHGINPAYIDKNHAGILIIWDRLYGTFAKEVEEPVYGTVSVVKSFDPIWANFEYWVYMAKVAWTAPNGWHKLAIWVAPPEWSPQGSREIPSVDARTFPKWDIPLAPGLIAYILTQFATVATFGTVWILWMEDSQAWVWLTALAVSILWATWSWGQLFHRRSIGVASEIARNLTVGPALAALAFAAPSPLPDPWAWGLAIGGGLFATASLLWVVWMRQAWTHDAERQVGAPQTEEWAPAAASGGV
jgi:sterol desaturase/sphingolipid hydroxylase (fatty acid hydroxylase superfamily)